MANQNFSWGVNGVGKEGVDYGNTNNWTDQQWADYNAKNGIPNPAQPAAPAAPASPAAPPPPAATNVQQQASNASTYSQTPGGAPTGPTANQGTQDVVRNTYLAQATQDPTAVTTNDPAIKAQTDPYNAAIERQKNSYLSGQAEQLAAKGLGSSGQMNNEQRYAGEQAGQQEGGFAAQLVGNEINARRQQVQDALSGLSGAITQDQKQALEEELAKLTQQTQMYGINTEAGTAANQQAINKQLGTGQLNLGYLSTLLNNQQQANALGLNYANDEAYWNNQALQNSF
jgi:hypothetical protein